MLKLNELAGFGVGGGEIPPITYANTWGIVNDSSTSTTFSNVSLVDGTKTLVFGIMQSANGYANRNTTGVTVGGVSATALGSANNNGYEYYSHLSFWEITTTLNVADIVVTRNSIASTHGAGVARMWVVPNPLGTPAASLTLIYTNTTGSLAKYKDGTVLALANGFSGTPYISGIASVDPISWVNVAAHEIPTSTYTATISHGPVTQYYNQMLYALSWT